MTRRHSPAAAALLAVGLLVVSSGGAFAQEEPVVEIDWESQSPLSGSVSGGDVVLEEAAPGVHPLTVIESPPLGGGDILMTVDVEVGPVGSPGFLELWAVYEDGGRFFSRSFDGSGLGLLRSGNALTVQLPFVLDGTVPASLELNVVLPDGGTVEIGDVALYELGPSMAILTADPGDGGWWSQRVSAIAGGIVGGLVGILGAMMGALASRGVARRLVVTVLGTGAVAGGAAVVVGLFALVSGQRYHVWFVLLLLGVIMAAVFGGLVRSVAARYEAMELHRMRAHDAG